MQLSNVIDRTILILILYMSNRSNPLFTHIEIYSICNYLIPESFCRWCGPCKILGPRLESMIGAKQGKVLMAKVDIDELSDLAIDHGVRRSSTFRIL